MNLSVYNNNGNFTFNKIEFDEQGIIIKENGEQIGVFFWRTW
jgi:hypothetical protein